MTSVKLHGANYVTWNAIIQTYLVALGKAHIIRRDPPPKIDSTYDRWEQEDTLVRSLLWQSMVPHISGPLMLLPTTKQIWDQITLLYSGEANIIRICSTYSEWIRLRRGDLSLATHYSQFVALCQQLDVFMPLTTDLNVDARQRDQIRVVQYLESLDPEYSSPSADYWIRQYSFPHQGLLPCTRVLS
ncbi:uncharacterized protein LOC143853906 [Tasmannia lanceolata]|uniref:uncharacterized protein LOC143853906 n=1 Tax=Tasmannia lanceolata TaxID=3420 RepID=UPI004064B0F9